MKEEIKDREKETGIKGDKKGEEGSKEENDKMTNGKKRRRNGES